MASGSAANLRHEYRPAIASLRDISGSWGAGRRTAGALQSSLNGATAEAVCGGTANCRASGRCSYDTSRPMGGDRETPHPSARFGSGDRMWSGIESLGIVRAGVNPSRRGSW